MKSLNKSIIFSIAMIFTITSVVAQSFTAPGSAGNTTLNGDVETVLGSGTFTFTALELKGNSTLTIPSGVTVVVNGPFTNKAGSTVIVNGALILNGASNENKGGGAITGTGTMTASNGIQNKGGGTVFGSTDPNPSCESGCSASTLPVELLSFDAFFENNVKIMWSTATEINNEYFSLERSEDGVKFYEIAKIEGNGNSSEVIEYAFEDDTYKNEVEYYRLKQVDFDGQFEVFKAIRVETNAGKPGNTFSIFPTHVTEGKVTIKGKKPFHVQNIQLISLTGNSNVYQPSATEVGYQSIEVNMNQVDNGLYLMKMVSDDGNEMTSKIFIN